MIDKILRSMGSFLGKQRVARLIFHNEIKNAKDLIIDGLYSAKYKLPNIQENIGFEIFINGIYEEETISLIELLIPNNGHYLDIGANIGSILIPLCIQRNDIKAIAVEASPWIFQYLRYNVELNDLKNVELFNFALLDNNNCEVDFFAPQDKFGKGSLSPIFTKRSEKVQSRTIDSIMEELDLKSVELIKIDVEGYEYFVFKGAENLLKSKNAPIILFEFVDWAENTVEGLNTGMAQQILLSMGFQLYRIGEKHNLIKLHSILHNGSHNLLAIPQNNNLLKLEKRGYKLYE